MTSKISYIKLIRADIRHRGWLAALTGIGLFLGMPVYTMLYIDSWFGGSPVVWVAEGANAAEIQNRAYMIEQIRNIFPGLLNGFRLSYLAAAIAVLAVLCALTGFGYIHSKEKLDFYHALPVKRGQWFAVSYISGLVIFLVPYVICSALTIAVGGINGIMTARVAAESVMAAAGGIFAFLIIYHTCILAAMLTGQTVTGLLAALVAAVYPFMVFGLFTAMKGIFFETYYGAASTLTDALAENLSPAGLFVKLITNTAAGVPSTGFLITAAVITVLLLGGALLLYRVYPSEAAGNALAFPRTAPVFKVMICIPAALFISLIAKSFMGISGTKWIVVLSLLTAVILCGVIEFIYQQDIRMLLKGWISSVISVAGVALVLCVFQFDLFGYDTYVPDQGRVESISFRPESFWGYFEYPENYVGYEDSSLVGSVASAEGTEALYRLAQTGVGNLEEGYTPGVLDLASSDSEIGKGYVNTVFRYKLSGGREVYRRYCLERGEVLSVLEELCRSEDVRKELFPIFHVDTSEVASVSFRDAYGVGTPAELSDEQMKTLLDAYKKDVMEVDINVLAGNNPLGELLLEIPDKSITDLSAESAAVSADVESGNSVQPGTVTMGSFYIYEGYENTLACMEEYGYTLRTKIAPEDVTQVTLYLSAESMRSGKYTELLSQLSPSVERFASDDGAQDITIRIQEDIRTVLEHIEPYNSGILGGGTGLGDYADIQFEEGSSYYSYKIK